MQSRPASHPRLRAPAPGASAAPTVPAAGATIAVRRSGRGPVIVGLHAVGHGASDFDGLAARLGDAFELVAPDWPGHGASPPEGAAPGSRRYGAILADLLVQLDLRDVVLVGNSVGGGASIVAAAQQPERVRGLVLCNTSGLVRHSPLVRFVCRRQGKLFARGEAGDPGYGAAFRRYYERTVLTGPRAAARREEIIRGAYHVAPVLRRAWLGFGEPEADLRALVPRVTCPVWIAWAKGDRVIRWSFSKAGARRFPDARVSFFEGSHAAFIEAPEAFDDGLRDFLASLPEHAGAASRAH